MAPSRGKGKATATRSTNRGINANRRTPRSTRKAKDDPPNVYQDLLAEATANGSAGDDSERPLKKRKVLPSASAPDSRPDAAGAGKQKEMTSSLIGRSKNEATGSNESAKHATHNLQVAEDSSQSDDEDESDFGFEDVDLEQPETHDPAKDEDEGIADITVSVDPATTSKLLGPTKRKPASVAEKAYRLLVHKAHILCLLGHCVYINAWCNNAVVQRHLRPILSKKTISYLNPKAEESQFQKNRSFIDGLQQASETFRGEFKVTASGMRRARRSDHEDVAAPQSETDPIDLSDFITAAMNLEGSQDTGNQLFCALLRSVGVEARLVCSLQTLPLVNAPATKPATPQRDVKSTVLAVASDTDSAASDHDQAVGTSKSIGKVPSARRRLGQPSFAPDPAPAPTPANKKKKPVRKLSYPIFWTEAFNTAQQKWTPVDPLVTQTVAKASKLEPPSAYDGNAMTYVIAFEEDRVVRDVTRRYSKSFNAKTRRHRVESTDNGTEWLRRAMRRFRRRGPPLDRDSIEDAELAAKEAREGLPNNVLDFKDHPYYALERHLKRNQVIHPKREVGKVNAGTAAKPRMEAVFRRSDVLGCRSADKWYRLGRIIQEGQQAVKHVPARTRPGGAGDVEASLTALYAPFQTEQYIAPPVVGGKIPKNAFGNLDIYVPSMVPTGGTHIRHKLTQPAAKILRIHFADAVTGFQFKGRHGTAIIEGAVVAEQFGPAVRAVIEGLEDEAVEEESRARSGMALRVWRRFLTGLRIRERVSAYGDPDASGDGDLEQQIDQEEDEQEAVADAGGFFPGEGEEAAMPTAGRFSLDQLAAPAKKQTRKRAVETESEDDGDEDLAEDDHDGEDEQEYVPSTSVRRSGWRRIVDDDDDDDAGNRSADVQDADRDDGEAGGFVPEETVDENGAGGESVLEDEGGVGGFVPDDAMNENGSGGGFVVANADMEGLDEESGGGFLVEQYDDGNGDVGGSATAPFDEDMQGGFIVDEGDHQTTTEGPVDPSIANVDDDSTFVQQNATVETPVISATQTASTANAAELPVAGDLTAQGETAPLEQNAHQSDRIVDVEDDELSDLGSMLSHDPEDEDAEPDWLESD